MSSRLHSTSGDSKTKTTSPAERYTSCRVKPCSRRSNGGPLPMSSAARSSIPGFKRAIRATLSTPLLYEEMKLEGIHHITCITGDAPRNVEFYAGLLGLRLVKKSVNQDDPTVYHLFYADEEGHAGSDMTFFEYPNARGGRAGAGMIHRVTWRLASEEALDFWEKRLADAGVPAERTEGSLTFDDPEGLGLELRVVDTDDEPLIADRPDIPKELALQGFDSVRAYSRDPDRSRQLF